MDATRLPTDSPELEETLCSVRYWLSLVSCGAGAGVPAPSATGLAGRLVFASPVVQDRFGDGNHSTR